MEKRSPVKLSSRLLLLLCMMALGLLVGTAVLSLFRGRSLLAMLTIQDLLLFIVPAMATMAMVYRRPFKAMAMDKAPSGVSMLIVLMFYIVSMPALNWLVSLNEAMSLPQSLSALEHWMRTLEDSAAHTTRQLLDIHTVGKLMGTVLVVGFMAGLSEEILFRGAMLRMMQDSRLGKHAVVWIVAIIFSAFHMQFYGFIPRLALGLWLGYLLVWTGNLWVPIIAHTLNNSTVVIFSYLAGKGIVPADFGDNIGLPADGSFPWMAVASLVASLAIAWFAGHIHQKSTFLKRTRL